MSKRVDNPKVSIVIPVYNGEKFVEEALKSAVNQTYKNLEILVIDDGSTDKTEAIVKKFGDKVRYIKKKNGGVSSALNLALKEMTGEYFSWLSHDDTYEKNKVEREIVFLREEGYLGKDVIVFSDYYLIDKKGKLISESKKNHLETVNKPEYDLLKGHINGLSLLIPKKAFDEFGEFDTEKVCTQDYEMWRKMARKYKLVHIPECLVSTRWHSKQVTNTNPKVLTEGNEFYISLIEEVPKKRMIELEGSEYCFMEELADFYANSVYEGAEKYCRKRMAEILKEAEKEVKKGIKKVSVIIPFYNRADVLERAIKSVKGQSYNNYEIILVDDGSSDDISTIEKQIKNDKKIKLIKNKKNMGASYSRNCGIKEATGDYIVFLDSDDEFVKEKLSIQLQYMIASGAKISHTSYIRDKGGDEILIDSGVDHGHCERKMIYSCGIATPTVMIDRKWLLSKGALFDEHIVIGEDTCFWLTLMKGGTYLIGINKPLSVVHVGKRAAAYDGEKQVIGLKEIIKFVLNDEYYSDFTLEIAYLMKPFTDIVIRLNSNEIECVATGNLVQKFIFFAKREGMKSAVKRTVKKVRAHKR